MKILLANKFYYSRGGDATYTLALEQALGARGHTVIPFAMDHPQTLPTPYRRHFAPPVDFVALLERGGLRAGWRAARSAIYSRAAAAALERLLAETRPQIAHAQNIHHQLSPAIFPALKRHGLPLVWTLHDYAPLCPNDNFFTHGAPCERCKVHRFYQCVRWRCKKGSLGASLIAALAAATHHGLGLYRHVDRVICPSRFLHGKLLEFGWPAERLVHLPYLLSPQAFERPALARGAVVVYAGRLAQEKGVDVLLRAAARAKLRVLIAGDGPERARLERLVEELGLGYTPFLGHLEASRLRELVAGAAAVAVPSLWYENFPFSVLEALALGVPVVASRIGGIPEIVVDGENGYLVPSGAVEPLADALRRLVGDPIRSQAMGQAGRARVAELCDPVRHAETLEQLYTSLS
ncbi:MAG TPA: glycosyltransferase family 4 protein [Acidobacteriota bacterium]